ncbi:alpha/beta hydrolase [Rhizobium sp. RM]|uniref:alpha/beta hydrolase n=1 Tax=Rhizobium sp. RM TaxID=2748079 RepID=UPI00110F4D1E|nr:alpha/beta hydrolase [Rhizobium sp. RM]NWJ26371.1 alpha/beta hydrolase [Rhizobium sp. RM]TMV17996.1 alpha/beta hydrolase [Rhizobium sp. Td3]
MTLTVGDTSDKSITVVLVHGAFVDASGWRQVFEILSREGYEVLVVQNSAVSLSADVERTRQVIADASNPVVLVGHSYGGAVITEAGTDEKVVCLVYLAAFVPEIGESVFDLASQAAHGAEKAPLLPPANGFIRVDSAKFPAAFAADVEPALTHFMAVAQRPWGLEAVQGKISATAWKNKPSYYLLATDDRMIPPEAQEKMAVRAGAKIVEVRSSHAVMLSQPEKVAALITTAAENQAT